MISELGILRLYFKNESTFQLLINTVNGMQMPLTVLSYRSILFYFYSYFIEE